MKFILKGTVTFSKNAEDAKEDIKKFIENANSELLLRGLGNSSESEGSKITNWKLNDNQLELEIKSGYKIRAHDGLLRMKNPLSQLLGKKYQLGVRKLHIDEYEIIIPTGEEGYQFDLKTAESLPAIVDIKQNEDNVTIVLKDIDESSIKKQIINRIIKQVATKKEDLTLNEEGEELDLTYKLNSTPGEIVAKSEKFKSYFEGDVTEKASELGWIKGFPGKGQWFYGPQITALNRIFEEIIIEKIVNKLGFQECLFPKLIPIEVMEKMKYLEGLPEGMYYVSAPKRDPDLFERFKSELIINIIID